MAAKIHDEADSDFEERQLNETTRRAGVARQPNTGTAKVPGSGVPGMPLSTWVERFRKKDEG